MGKKRIAQLLNRLKDNQQQDAQNAASIFTVAQVAVNELEQLSSEESTSAQPALPPSPISLTKAILIERYGSYNACRRAATAQGIRFAKTPSWQMLITAFEHATVIQQLAQHYAQQRPEQPLSGITFTVKL